MKNKISLAIALTLTLATGVSSIALAKEAKASSEDLHPITTEKSKEQIEDSIETNACYRIPVPPYVWCNW